MKADGIAVTTGQESAAERGITAAQTLARTWSAMVGFTTSRPHFSSLGRSALRFPTLPCRLRRTHRTVPRSTTGDTADRQTIDERPAGVRQCARLLGRLSRRHACRGCEKRRPEAILPRGLKSAQSILFSDEECVLLLVEKDALSQMEDAARAPCCYSRVLSKRRSHA